MLFRNLLGKAFLGPHLLEQGVSTIASIAERIRLCLQLVYCLAAWLFRGQFLTDGVIPLHIEARNVT